ncbi:hypothetical protein D8862_07010 [Streptococcus oralis]|uniref:Excreted peptide n=2 Tax=Streptococcus oralis TaxID=1303 RepID=A0A3R9PLY4_STROR|nr:hypothetical protein [Streptococcus oralis]RSI64220.1 hypothetical protein D8862_07010 [Streptococcus oralis]
MTVEEKTNKIDKKELYYKCEPTIIYFKKVLAMTGTETFTVLSTEDLEKTSGSGMIWLVDDRHWDSPYAYSLATEWSTILNHATRRAYGIGC